MKINHVDCFDISTKANGTFDEREKKEQEYADSDWTGKRKRR